MHVSVSAEAPWHVDWQLGSTKRTDTSTKPSPQVTATASLDEIAASTEETLVLYDLAIGLAGHVDLGDVGDVIAKH